MCIPADIKAHKSGKKRTRKLHKANNVNCNAGAHLQMDYSRECACFEPPSSHPSVKVSHVAGQSGSRAAFRQQGFYFFMVSRLVYSSITFQLFLSCVLYLVWRVDFQVYRWDMSLFTLSAQILQYHNFILVFYLYLRII